MPEGNATTEVKPLGGYQSFIEITSSLLALILDMTAEVYSLLDKYSSDSKFRDDLYVSAGIVDNDLCAIFTTMYAGIVTEAPVKLELGATGTISVMGAQLSKATIKEETTNTPTPAVAGLAILLDIIKDFTAIGTAAADLTSGICDIDKKDYDGPDPEDYQSIKPNRTMEVL